MSSHDNLTPASDPVSHPASGLVPPAHLDGREPQVDLRAPNPTPGIAAHAGTATSTPDGSEMVAEAPSTDLIQQEPPAEGESAPSAGYRPRHAAHASTGSRPVTTPTEAPQETSVTDTPYDSRPDSDGSAAPIAHPAGDQTPPPRRLSWSVIRGVRPLTLASDLTACLIASVVASANPLRAMVFAFVLVILFVNSRLYRSRLTLSALDDLPRIFLGWLGATAITTAAAAFVHDRLGTPSVWSDTRAILTSASFLTLPLLVLGRTVAYAIIRRARAQRRVGHRTLIMGAGHVGEQIAGILRDHPEYGLNPYCFLDDKIPGRTKVAGLPVMGTSNDLSNILRDNSIHIVIVAFSHMKEHDMVGLIRTSDRLDSELFVVPRLYELHQVEGDMDSVWGVPLIRLRRAAYRSVTWPLKRLFDIACSGLALIVLGIPMAIIALAVRLDGGPGVIFRQDRVGVDGRHVEVMKFRSMKPADKNESQTQWNIAKDNRVTPLGRFLRKTSLDELPQLINILRGDMSIVGPRPERPHFVNQFQERYPAYNARHRVPCGLTGLAAVSGLRGDTSIEDRARFDNYYIQNWSLWLDIKIILRTVSSVVTGAGG